MSTWAFRAVMGEELDSASPAGTAVCLGDNVCLNKSASQGYRVMLGTISLGSTSLWVWRSGAAVVCAPLSHLLGQHCCPVPCTEGSGGHGSSSKGLRGGGGRKKTWALGSEGQGAALFTPVQGMCPDQLSENSKLCLSLPRSSPGAERAKPCTVAFSRVDQSWCGF